MVLRLELRRPSILRSGNHTFEYVGFGPGNYSTGLPSVQNRVLTDEEVLLAQSQKEEGGIAFYSGLNSNGDLFIGNTKISSVTGEEADLDTPTLSLLLVRLLTYVLRSMRLSFVISSRLNLKLLRVKFKGKLRVVVNLLLKDTLTVADLTIGGVGQAVKNIDVIAGTPNAQCIC